MLKNILVNFIGRFWAIISNFLFIPLYIKYLGFESYSIISFTIVISGLMIILDAGLSSTLSREFARLDIQKVEKIRFFRTIETTYFVIIGITITLVYSFSDLVSNHWLNLKSIHPKNVSLFIKIVSFDIGFQLLLRFYLGGLFGFEKQIKANIYQIGWSFLRNGCVLCAIMIVPNLSMFFIWQTLSTILFAILIRCALYQSLFGSYKILLNPIIEKLVIEKIWRFAGGVLLISIVAGLNTQIDKIFITKLLPIEILGHYTLAVSLSMGLLVIVNPISISLLPRFTALYSLGKLSDATLLFNKFSLIVAILVFSLLSILIFFPSEMIWIWTGDLKLAANASYYLPIIAFSYAMIAITVIPYNVAIANGYTKLNNLLGIISLLVTLPGYWVAIKFYGVIGATIVYCVVQTASTFIYILIINKKFLKVNSISKLLGRQVLFPIAISFFIAFLFSRFSDFVNHSRIIYLLCIIIIIAISILTNMLLLFPFNTIKKKSILFLNILNETALIKYYYPHKK